jgi:glycosyltransferase involved in cell wall biosynthesis
MEDSVKHFRRIVDAETRNFSFESIETAKSAAANLRNPASVAKLSVVIPCFNVEGYVADTCHSVVTNSRHLDLEVILVNDGSTDKSVAVARSILEKGLVCTTIVTIPNSGLSAARNVGLAFASAPFMAFLDADDLMSSDAYVHLWRYASARGCDQVFARSSAFNDGRFDDFEFYDSQTWNLILSGLARHDFSPLSEPLVFMTEPKTCTRIWRTDFLRENSLEFPEGRIFEDIGFHLRSLALSARIGIVDVQGLVYRVGRTGALTLDKSRKRFDILANISEALDTSELQSLPGEAGAHALLGLMRICRWCRNMIDLRLHKEFDDTLASCYARVPRSWLASLYTIDPREAERFLMAAAKGRTFSNLSTFLKRMVRKKPGRGLRPYRDLGANLPTSELSPVRRFHYNEIRYFGPSLAMLPFDTTAVFLSPASGGHALRISKSNPAATIFVVQSGSTAIFAALSQQSNVRLFSSPGELLSALREEGPRLGLVDLGNDATLALIAGLDNFEVDFLVGAFDPLVVEDTPAFLSAARAQVRRGYFLWRHDGQRYTYARSAQGPAVSVVVPVYNVLPYLDECVSALSAQTLGDREILLVDDGATDGSAARCDEWAQKDPTVRVIHKQNGGCASARMAGLAEARGEYVTFVDGDDWVDPTMLQRLFDLALRTGDELVEGGWCFAFPSGTTEDQTGDELAQCYPDRGGIMRRRRAAALVAQPTIWRRLYRRAFLQNQKIGFDIRLRRFDDMPFQFQALINTGDIAYSDHCLTYYRQNREGQDIGVTDERLYVHFPILGLLRESALTSGDKEVYRNFLMIQYHTHDWALTKIKSELRATYRNFMARDLFGPEQYESSLANLVRLLRLFPKYRTKVLKIYIRYLVLARNLRLPTMEDVR